MMKAITWFMRSRGIRTKIVGGFLLVSVLPLTVIILLSVGSVRASLTAEKVRELQVLADLKVDSISRFSGKLNEDVRLAREFPQVKETIGGLIAESLNPTGDAYEALLKRYDGIFKPLKVSGNYIDILIVDESTRLVYTTGDVHTLDELNTIMSFNDDAFFTETENIISYSEVFFSEYSASGFEMLARGPIVDTEGNLAGYVIFAIDMGPIYSEIQKTDGLGETGETFLAKHVLAHPDKHLGGHASELSEEHVFFLNPLRYDKDAALKRTIVLGSELGTPIQEASVGNSGSGVSLDYRGVEVVAAWRYVPDFDWGLVAKQDSREALVLANTFVRRAILLEIGFIALLTPLAFLVGSSIARPIKSLRDVVNKVGAGDRSVRIDVEGSDEVGQLASEFNKMVYNLKTATTEITKGERKLEESYQELLEQNEELNKTKSAMLNLLEDGRKLEGDLKEERDRINQIIRSMGEGLVVLDPDMTIRIVNPAATEMLGYSEEEMVGKNWLDYVTAFDGQREMTREERISSQVAKTGELHVTKVEDNHYYESKEGRRIPLISVTAPLGENAKNGVVKVFRDATVEKEARALVEEQVVERTAELKEQQATSYAILENTIEGVVLTNQEGKVTYVNPSFTRLTGYELQAFGDNSFSDVVSGFDVTGKPLEPRDMSDAAVVTAHGTESKKLLLHKDGKTKVAVSVSASPVNVDEVFKGVVRIYHDYKDELEVQQQKDDFFSIASHELRTPLSVIAGNIDTILEGYGKSQLSVEDRQLMSDSAEAADRLIKMVNDFLNVSRLDQGRLKYQLEEIDICTLTESVAHEMKNLTDERGIYLKYECGLEHGKVIGDEGLLKEILINLVGNAVKFTSEGGITISHKAAGDNLEIRVVDTGMGIEPEKHKILFQRFQQAMNRTTAREAGGTGLGLYISREFAKTMGGDLILEKSEVGHGSTFLVVLKLATDENKQKYLSQRQEVGGAV